MVNKIINKILILGLMTSAFLLASCDWFESGGSSGEISWSGGGGAVPQDDGLPDAYEQSDSADYYGLDLYALGARADQVDLFIHVAPMHLENSLDYDLMLQKAALDKVVAAFLEVGIYLHFDVGTQGLYEGDRLLEVSEMGNYNLSELDHRVPFNNSITLSLGDGDRVSSLNSGDDAANFVSVENYKEGYNYPVDNDSDGDADKDYAFHYMVFGSSQENNEDPTYGWAGSSGLAWLNDTDFLITLNDWGFHLTPTTNEASVGITEDDLENYIANKQASTIMHEFGHNLGLYHGGDESLNYKPNYNSIMNYLYQMKGLPDIGNKEGERYYLERLYYADSDTSSNWLSLLTTDHFNYYFYSLEYDLNNGPYSDTFEISYSHGYGGPKTETNIYESTGLRQNGSGSVDFNGSGSVSDGIIENINPSYDSSFSTLYDYDDWHNLSFFYAENTSSGRSIVDYQSEYVREDNRPMNMFSFVE